MDNIKETDDERNQKALMKKNNNNKEQTADWFCFCVNGSHLSTTRIGLSEKVLKERKKGRILIPSRYQQHRLPSPPGIKYSTFFQDK